MKKSSFKLLVLGVFAFLAASPVFASQNIISSVIISQSKENPNFYELNIDSTSSVGYRAHEEEDGSVYFDLKNSILAQNAGTVYDDVSDIDNVTVKQLDKNKVRIYVKGKNAKNTDIVFLNSLYEAKAPSKKVVINRPVSDYQPTNTDLEDQEDIQEWDDNSFNFSHLLASVLSGLKEGPSGIVLIILFAFAFFAIIIKTLAAKLSSESEPLIGLNSSLNSVRREEAMLRAQEELTKAHQKYQQYLLNKNRVNTDPIKQGIALNQYQKNDRNPYSTLDKPALYERTPLKQSESKVQNTNRPAQTNRNFSTPYIQRPNKKVDYVQKQNINPNNLRFLESVTKIYERSGRSDLANELKNSVLKVKQSI